MAILTAGFVSAPFVRAAPHGFGQGFQVYDDSVAYKSVLELSKLAESLNAAAQTWLASWVPGSQPLFLLLYYFDPHTWYNPPPPYNTLYDSTYTGTLTPGVYRNGEDVVGGKVVPSARDVEHLLALYDGEIAILGCAVRFDARLLAGWWVAGQHPVDDDLRSR